MAAKKEEKEKRLDQFYRAGVDHAGGKAASFRRVVFLLIERKEGRKEEKSNLVSCLLWLDARGSRGKGKNLKGTV